jgi:hypothetical protein
VKYDQATRDQMTALVREWATSGETQATFIERHGLTIAKFRHWQQVALEKAEAVRFAPVQVVDAPRDDTVLEVTLPGGLRVLVRSGASATLVQTLVTALRAAC